MSGPLDEKLSQTVHEGDEDKEQRPEPPAKSPSEDPVSKTDAPSLGMWDTIKRRVANSSQTQREEDVAAAEAADEWAPTGKESDVSRDATPRDTTGVNPEGVVDESMPYYPRG